MNDAQKESFAKFASFVLDGNPGCTELVFWGGHYDSKNGTIVRSPYNTTLGGWFDRPQRIRDMIARARGVSAYVTVNPVHRDLLAQCANNVQRIKGNEGTKKEHILFIRFLMIDVDVDRGITQKEKISSTDEELASAVALRDRILSENKTLAENSMWGVSGNGAYVLCRLNGGEGVPNTPHYEGLIKEYLKRLAHKYGRKGRDPVHIDTNPYFANIHIGLPGSVKCKGSHTEERPHRPVTVDGVSPLSPAVFLLPEQIEALDPDPGVGRAGGPEDSPPAGRPRKGGAAPDDAKRNFHFAKLWIAKVPSAVANNGGHNRTFEVAVGLVHGFGLPRDSAYELMSQWSQTCQPPWTAEELNHKLDDAEAKDNPDGGKPKGWRVPPARAIGVAYVETGPKPAECPEDTIDDPVKPEFKNFVVTGTSVDREGVERVTRSPRPVDDIYFDHQSFFGEWPKKVNGDLFVEGPNGSPRYLRTSDSFFSWLDSRAEVRWRNSGDYVTFGRYYEHVKAHAEEYISIESMPHWPPLPGSYYMCPQPPEVAYGRLEEFLSFFKGETPADRELMKAFVLSIFWGGRPGTRPAFLVTSSEGSSKKGLGVGKSTFVSVIGDELAGGVTDVENVEGTEAVKKRLLSDGCRASRVIRIDNLKTLKFSWAGLEGLITSPNISGWMLYKGEGRRPNMVVWAITVNGASLSKDMSQRVIPIKLVRPEHVPEWENAVRRFAVDHRDAILSDVRALLSAPDDPEFAAVTRWAPWEAGVLSKVNGWQDCQETILARQDAVDHDAEETMDTGQAVAAKIKEANFDPHTCCVFISNQTMIAWYREIADERRDQRYVGTLIANLGIPQLTRSPRTADERGWIWKGLNAPFHAEPARGQRL